MFLALPSAVPLLDETMCCGFMDANTNDVIYLLMLGCETKWCRRYAMARRLFLEGRTGPLE